MKRIYWRIWLRVFSGIGLMCLLLIVNRATAAGPDSLQTSKWSLHFQQTVIPQYHFNFKAPYTGKNSLQPEEKMQVSLTSTMFIARKLWKNATAVFNPEMAGGSGLSQAHGIAGFTNGEAFRIGSPAPKIYAARYYVRQLFALSAATEQVENEVNQV